MAATVFVSHSRKDENLDFFHKLFNATEPNPIFVELEKIERPAWKPIVKYVSESECVFLLLSKELSESIYTQNWVSFEIGLASAMNKPVWVFESVNEPVDFPVPYCNFHMVLDAGDDTCFQLLKGVMGRLTSYDSGVQVQCQNKSCKLEFTATYDSNVYICPACRKDTIRAPRMTKK